jgi:hydrogenase maturation factor
VLVVKREDAGAVEAALRSKGHDAYRIGEIVAGEREVRLL